MALQILSLIGNEVRYTTYNADQPVLNTDINFSASITTFGIIGVKHEVLIFCAKII